MSDRPTRLLAAAALAAALLAPGCAATAEGRHAPPVQGSEWFEAKDPSLAAPAYPAKGRWTLVVFFRATAVACGDGIPAILEFLGTFGPRGVSAVGVTASGRDETEPFVVENRIPFAVLAEAQPVVNAWGIPRVERNLVYLVDPAGVVVVQDDLAGAAALLDRHLGQ